MNIEPKKTGGPTGEGTPIQRARPGAPARALSGPATPPRAVAPSADDLVLSPRAQEFRKVRGRIDGLAAGAGSRRVAELRAAVANGTYQVDADRVAAAVLRDEMVGPLLEEPR